MNWRPAIVLALLVVVPVVGLTWLGLRIAADQEHVHRQQVESRLRGRLAESAERVSRFVTKRRRQVEEAMPAAQKPAALAKHLTPSALRARLASSRMISNIFVRGSDGRMTFPPRDKTATQAERDFVRRLQKLWEDGALAGTTQAEKATGGGGTQSGWTTWYWQSGLHLLHWRRLAGGVIVGAEIDRVVLLADLIAELPTTHDAGSQERIALMGARGEVLYQWGAYEPPKGSAPRFQHNLQPPLSAWKLQIFVPAATLSAAGEVDVALFAGIGALAVALLGLALWLYRAGTQQLRDTAQKVGFVNQVSHELKTPLTNIRMYAELLERDAEDLGPAAQRRLDIIVGESQRLSRLIANVLTYARQQRRALTVRPRQACLDDVVSDVLEQFAPALRRKGFDVVWTPGAPEMVLLDPDAIGQIVGNLVGNVEKYAAHGGELSVESHQGSGTVRVVVGDRGPGIARRHAEQIFEPFYRIEDGITEGVAGTGIGLALARELARLHGGDLKLVHRAGEGACFELAIGTGESS